MVRSYFCESLFRIFGEYCIRWGAGGDHIKGTVARDFEPVFLAVGMNLGLKMYRLCFLNFNVSRLILDNYFKF
jgi:hypothetical protein